MVLREASSPIAIHLAAGRQNCASTVRRPAETQGEVSRCRQGGRHRGADARGAPTSASLHLGNGSRTGGRAVCWAPAMPEQQHGHGLGLCGSSVTQGSQSHTLRSTRWPSAPIICRCGASRRGSAGSTGVPRRFPGRRRPGSRFEPETLSPFQADGPSKTTRTSERSAVDDRNARPFGWSGPPAGGRARG